MQLSPAAALQVSEFVLGLHLAVIAFNIVGLVAVPLGAWRRWSWVRVRWWRALHVAALSLVAAQALLGDDCFLTVWESGLLRAAGRSGYAAPFIQTWVDRIIYWSLPMAFFTALYVAVWIYVLALWHWVPPARKVSPPR